MAISDQSIEEQIAIINEQKNIDKDIMQLKTAIEKYKDTIITTLKNVDQRAGTDKLVSQINSVESTGINTD